MVQKLKKWWQRLSTTPWGRWLFSKVLAWLIPYTGTIDPRVLELKPGFARVCIKDRRIKRNHLNSIHALALANLGELTTGLCLHLALNEGDQAILTKLEVNYLKKARGVITAQAELAPGADVSGAVPVTAQLCDSMGEQVAIVQAHWLVRHSKV